MQAGSRSTCTARACALPPTPTPNFCTRSSSHTAGRWWHAYMHLTYMHPMHTPATHHARAWKEVASASAECIMRRSITITTPKHMKHTASGAPAVTADTRHVCVCVWQTQDMRHDLSCTSETLPLGGNRRMVHGRCDAARRQVLEGCSWLACSCWLVMGHAYGCCMSLMCKCPHNLSQPSTNQPSKAQCQPATGRASTPSLHEPSNNPGTQSRTQPPQTEN